MRGWVSTQRSVRTVSFWLTIGIVTKTSDGVAIITNLAQSQNMSAVALPIIQNSPGSYLLDVKLQRASVLIGSNACRKWNDPLNCPGWQLIRRKVISLSPVDWSKHRRRVQTVPSYFKSSRYPYLYYSKTINLRRIRIMLGAGYQSPRRLFM